MTQAINVFGCPITQVSGDACPSPWIYTAPLPSWALSTLNPNTEPLGTLFPHMVYLPWGPKGPNPLSHNEALKECPQFQFIPPWLVKVENLESKNLHSSLVGKLKSYSHISVLLCLTLQGHILSISFHVSVAPLPLF